MRVILRFILLGAVFCVLTVGALVAWSTESGTKEGAVAQLPSGASEVVIDTLQRPPAEKPSIGVPPTGTGTIYAPRDVVDLTRLVLEASRDQTAHLARYIEYATTIVVVFFTLLGAVGATFGLHKLHDVENTAKAAVEKFEKDLSSLKQGADARQAEFQSNIDKATADLHREINDQIELIAARAEIDQAMNFVKQDAGLANRMLRNASTRIEAVLTRQQVSVKGRIRGMADLAYTVKRLGDHERAHSVVMEAAHLAKNSEPTMFPLLAYNTACYASLLDKVDACDWLSQAIQANPQYKESAKKDQDFDKIKDSERFKKLTE